MTAERDEGALRVSLPAFEGPLDLLLHLVKERRLDVATVPLASVAEQYFAYVTQMEALDMELAAEYLVIAATLVFLKSRALLPPLPSDFGDEGEDSPEEVEERLRRRLIAYSRFKSAADDLRIRQLEASAYYYRDAGDPGTDLVQRYRIAPQRLGSALLAAVRSARPERRTIARERYSIARQMDFVDRAVRAKGTVEFAELCRNFDRGGIIATFLAILELIRIRRIGFEQPRPFEQLRLFAHEAVHAN